MLANTTNSGIIWESGLPGLSDCPGRRIQDG